MRKWFCITVLPNPANEVAVERIVIVACGRVWILLGSRKNSKRGKGITKEGRRELRWAMVEVAQRAVKADPHWKSHFLSLERRMHRNQAIVAIARHLLTIVWSVLTHKTSYHHYSDERIAYKYYTWSWQLNETQRKGLTRPQFVRYYLMKLGIGRELQRVALDPKHPHRLASEAEILELMPELKPPG